MRRYLLAAVLAVAPFVAPSAWAQNVYTAPALSHGSGVLSLTTSSVAVTTLTLAPNSPALLFPLPSATISFQAISTNAGSAWLCPLGGTCSASNAVEIPPGATVSISVSPNSATAPTLVATSTATVQVIW